MEHLLLLVSQIVKSLSWLFNPLLYHSGSRNGCLEISVPKTVGGDSVILKISLHILVSPINCDRATTQFSNQGSKMVTKYKSVKLLKKENYLLVQTDKGQYKAKDIVKFRVLALDHDLRWESKSPFLVISCFSDPVR